MTQPILQIQNLGKRYTLSHRREPHRGLRHALTDALQAPFRKRPNKTSAPEEFWALNDVSFNVAPGQVVGVIGRNGAGKSTLLKIISRITIPTTGRISLNGRVASLLEVGTGFHPELTGRENIFLNGAILGMKQAEIKRKFDEIVAFAEIDRFLDTPVKRYSSGMYMRLAFAVAAHLEPDLLIVDEVLAVGDAAFQQKCLGKMSEVASQKGRTILFVSHNLAAVQKLCSECKLLEAGHLIHQGPPKEVVRHYLDLFARQQQNGTSLNPQDSCEVRLRILNPLGQPTQCWRYGERLEMEVTVSPKNTLHHPAVDLAFYDDHRTRLFALQSDRLGAGPDHITGCWTAHFQIENPGLTLPEISLDVGIREGAGHYLTLIQDAGRLSLDHSSVPDAASSDCLLHPRSSHTWKSTTTQ